MSTREDYNNPPPSRQVQEELDRIPDHFARMAALYEAETKSLVDRIIEGERELDGNDPQTLCFLMAEHWRAVAMDYRARAKDYDRIKTELCIARAANRQGAAQLAALPPGSYYMDPPDGGDTPILEQLRRMAKDAELGRTAREHAEAAIACERRCEG